MAGVNKVILVGNVGKDPEIRFTQDSKAIANFSIATSETWKDRNTGQKQERTEWHKCNVYGGLAEVVQKYVKKGSKLYIEGSSHTRKWQDQSGADRYSTEVKVKEMQMLDSRTGDNNQAPQNQNNASQNANTQPANNQQSQQFQKNNSSSQVNQQQNQAPQQSRPFKDEFDDDIPFN